MKSCFYCELPNQLPCMKDHNRCFNITDICIYKLDRHQRVLPCRLGNHLENCISIACNKHFKCLDSYCIPWSYVCDGMWDCPKGYDETNYLCTRSKHCRQMFKCRHSQNKCIHRGNICDGKYDCPFHDDEFQCALQHINCPTSCFCLSLAIKCRDRINSFETVHLPFISISLINVQHPFGRLIEIFPQATFLTMNNNYISDVCYISLFPEIISIDAAFNHLKIIHRDCFVGRKSLSVILLNNNDIFLVQHKSFNTLPSLHFISLSSNPLISMSSNFIVLCKSLRLFEMKHTRLFNLDPMTFLNLQIAVIDTSDYHLCCIIYSHSKCTAELPWYVSCSDILGVYYIKMLYIFFTILCLFLNFTSLLFNALSHSSQTMFSILMSGINVGNLAYAFYLSFIWLTNIYFDGVFMIKEAFWRSSNYCFIIFTIALFHMFSIQSFMFLTFVSRFMVVLYPMDTKFKNPHFVRRSTVFVILFSFVLSTLLAIFTKLTHGQLSTSICYPFVDPSHLLTEIHILAWVFAISHFICVFVNICLSTLLVKKLGKYVENFVKSFSNSKSIFQQLLAQNISIILCWIPADVVHLCLYFISHYPKEIILLLPVTFLCIIPITFPTLFIIIQFKSRHVGVKTFSTLKEPESF